MSRPPSPRWRRRAEARPDEILDAALAEFDARGFDAARMEDIARRAGISKAGLYLYFPSKDALLKALVETRVAPVARLASAQFSAGAADPKATIKQVGAMLAERLDDPAFFAVPRLVLSLAGRYPEIAEHYRKQVVEFGRGALERLIAAGVQSGQLRDVDPALAARAFIGAFVFEALWTQVLRGPRQENPRAWAEAQVDFIFEALSKETSP